MLLIELGLNSRPWALRWPAAFSSALILRSDMRSPVFGLARCRRFAKAIEQCAQHKTGYPQAERDLWSQQFGFRDGRLFGYTLVRVRIHRALASMSDARSLLPRDKHGCSSFGYKCDEKYSDTSEHSAQPNKSLPPDAQ
jgi:hypothetical protein